MHFSENLAYFRAMISSHQYSFFFAFNCTWERNEARKEAVVLFIDTAEDLPVLSEDGESFVTIVRQQSYMSSCKIFGNIMKSGGTLIHLVGSNLYIIETIILGNQIWSSHAGISLTFAHL